MAVRSEGEFELVLGNRQLFSVLGIVVILLGIFFAMGFFAGKSGGQASANAVAAAPSVEQAPLVVDSPQTSTLATAPASREPAAAEPAAAPQKIATEKEANKRATDGKSGPAASKTQAPSPAKPASAKDGDQVEKPAPGSYLQVASTRLSEAQSLSALLRKHEFHVVLAESPKAELVRVLVGPFATPEAAAQARAKLKSLDIAKPYPVKY